VNPGVQLKWGNGEKHRITVVIGRSSLLLWRSATEVDEEINFLQLFRKELTFSNIQ